MHESLSPSLFSSLKKLFKIVFECALAYINFFSLIYFRYLRNNVLSTLANHGDEHAVNYSLTGFRMWMKNQRLLQTLYFSVLCFFSVSQGPLILNLINTKDLFLEVSILFSHYNHSVQRYWTILLQTGRLVNGITKQCGKQYG